MTGRSRLPGGEPHKARQRNTRRSGQSPARIAPSCKTGDVVLSKGRRGTVRRDLGDAEHTEIALAERIYRMRLSELG
jgi:hypothetical protein